MTPENTTPHTQAADAVHEHRPVDAQFVRGARPDRRILWILICSAGAAAILLLGMWMLSNGGFASQNGNNGAQPVDTQAFSSSAPPTADAPTTATGAAQPVPTGEAPNVNAPNVPSNAH
jgi:hypothetical protein